MIYAGRAQCRAGYFTTLGPRPSGSLEGPPLPGTTISGFELCPRLSRISTRMRASGLAVGLCALVVALGAAPSRGYTPLTHPGRPSVVASPLLRRKCTPWSPHMAHHVRSTRAHRAVADSSGEAPTGPEDGPGDVQSPGETHRGGVWGKLRRLIPRKRPTVKDITKLGVFVGLSYGLVSNINSSIMVRSEGQGRILGSE